MINKSFFRKRSTRIYLALFSVVYIFIFLINIVDNNINKQIVDNLIDSTLAYCTCTSDCYDELVNSDIVANIRNSYLLDSKLDEDYQEEFNTERTDYKLLLSENKQLNNNEVILYYEDFYYQYNKESIDRMKTIHIDGIEYYIKDIRRDSNVSHIEISSSVLTNLKNEDTNIYLFNLKIPDDMVFEYFENVNNLTQHTANKYKVSSTLNKYLDITKIFSILMFIVSIIIYFVVLGNLFYDFSKCNKLEKYLGFKKSRRTFNCYSRITSLFILSILIAGVLAFLISLLVGYFIDGITIKFNYYIFLYFLIIEIIKFIFLFILRI